MSKFLNFNDILVVLVTNNNFTPYRTSNRTSRRLTIKPHHQQLTAQRNTLADRGAN